MVKYCYTKPGKVGVDIRGFVRTTHAGEKKEEVGLSSVANWLRRILSEVIRIAFENRGLVGELSGDSVLAFALAALPGSVLLKMNGARN